MYISRWELNTSVIIANLYIYPIYLNSLVPLACPSVLIINFSKVHSSGYIFTGRIMFQQRVWLYSLRGLLSILWDSRKGLRMGNHSIFFTYVVGLLYVLDPHLTCGLGELSVIKPRTAQASWRRVGSLVTHEIWRVLRFFQPWLFWELEDDRTMQFSAAVVIRIHFYGYWNQVVFLEIKRLECLQTLHGWFDHQWLPWSIFALVWSWWCGVWSPSFRSLHGGLRLMTCTSMVMVGGYWFAGGVNSIVLHNLSNVALATTAGVLWLGGFDWCDTQMQCNTMQVVACFSIGRAADFSDLGGEFCHDRTWHNNCYFPSYSLYSWIDGF